MIDSFRDSHRFLSNFHRSPILCTFTGITFPTVEHYFQAKKTCNDEEQAAIAAAVTALEAKRLGRSVTLRSDWEAIKLNVMRDALALKFSHGSNLAVRLDQTGDHLLVEGNTWGDNFWGSVRGNGQNWLGRLLMARRAELRGF